MQLFMHIDLTMLLANLSPTDHSALKINTDIFLNRRNKRTLQPRYQISPYKIHKQNIITLYNKTSIHLSLVNTYIKVSQLQ